MAVNFYATKKFYNVTTSVKENIIETTFDSGKTRRILMNTSPKKIFNLSFTLTSKTDEASFWNWYEKNLYSRANTLYLTDLITRSGTSEYIMTSEPQIQDSQYPKECQISLEEA